MRNDPELFVVQIFLIVVAIIIVGFPIVEAVQRIWK